MTYKPIKTSGGWQQICINVYFTALSRCHLFQLFIVILFLNFFSLSCQTHTLSCQYDNTTCHL